MNGTLESIRFARLNRKLAKNDPREPRLQGIRKWLRRQGQLSAKRVLGLTVILTLLLAATMALTWLIVDNGVIGYWQDHGVIDGIWRFIEEIEEVMST